MISLSSFNIFIVENQSREISDVDEFEVNCAVVKLKMVTAKWISA
jgi:hypothetical protein